MPGGHSPRALGQFRCPSSAVPSRARAELRGALRKLGCMKERRRGQMGGSTARKRSPRHLFPSQITKANRKPQEGDGTPGRVCLQSEGKDSNRTDVLLLWPVRTTIIFSLVLSFSLPVTSAPGPLGTRGGGWQGPRSSCPSPASITSDPPVAIPVFTDLLISIKHSDIFKSSPFTSHETCRV